MERLSSLWRATAPQIERQVVTLPVTDTAPMVALACIIEVDARSSNTAVEMWYLFKGWERTTALTAMLDGEPFYDIQSSVHLYNGLIQSTSQSRDQTPDQQVSIGETINPVSPTAVFTVYDSDAGELISNRWELSPVCLVASLIHFSRPINSTGLSLQPSSWRCYTSKFT
jgi:hypothetical protein